MLVSGRIAEVRRLAAQVGGIGVSLRQQKPGTVSRADRLGLQARREKLLFRSVPVALSLVERGVSQVEHQHRVKPSSSGWLSGQPDHGAVPQLPGSPARLLRETAAVAVSGEAAAVSHDSHVVPVTAHSDTRPRFARAVLVGLLPPLHALEGERKGLLTEKRASLERHHAQLHAELRRLTNSPAARRGHQHDKDVEVLRRAIETAEEDLSMLRGSLIARPFLSARLWRLLLRREAWISLVQSASGDSGTNNASALVHLLRALLYLSQLTLGVVVEYVQGSEVNRVSPRFVVSLPSPTWRARQPRAFVREEADTPGAVAVAVAVSAVDDPLMEMMLGTMAESSEEASPRASAVRQSALMPPRARYAAISPRHRRRRRATGDLRWLPAHASHSVMAYAHETLALFSFVIPSLEVERLVSCGKSEALLTLLVSVRQLATVVVAAQPSDLAYVPRDDLVTARRDTLSQLQTVLLHAACELKDALAALCVNGDDTPGAVGSLVFHPSPGAAARFLVEMDSLYLLRPGEPNSDALIDHLVPCLFPQLRTHTFEKLQQKAQASSLMAFTTRRHRSHLRRDHGGADAASHYLEGTVIQQARLQNRQLSAALRERRLSDIHLKSLSHLSEGLTASDLLSLFQLLAVRAHAAHASAGSDQAEVLSCDRAVTAAMFVAEALLLSRAVSEGSPETPRADAQLDTLFTVDQTARLWLALVTLWPVVRDRDAMRRAAGPSHGSRGAHSEKAALTFLGEFALRSVSATLAQALTLSAAEKKAPSGSAPARVGLRAAELQSLAVGLIEWGTVCAPRRPDGRQVETRNGTLDDAVATTVKLVRKTILNDSQLWHEVRTWDAEQRQDLARVLLECFQAHNLLDSVAMDAVEGMCYAGSV